jgi:DNA/RNA-binding domain of Phe-tRNA-synthetase-like protein
MRISIDNELIDRLGRIRLALIKAIVTCTHSSLELTQLISNTAERIGTIYKLEEINQFENIRFARIAYKKVGNDPNRYRPSADSLYRRIVKRNGLYSVNNVVDSLNLISIETGISIGGYDTHQIKGQISFGIGKTGEVYEGIGRGTLNISSLPVLRDIQGAFGNPSSDSERTKISFGTTKILFIFFDFGLDAKIDEILNRTSDLLKTFCSASELSNQILDFK